MPTASCSSPMAVFKQFPLDGLPRPTPVPSRAPNLSGKLGVMAALTVRSLWVHRLKTTVVGSIVCTGAFLFVLGTALLDTVAGSMSQSVIGSVSGHLQIYSAQARDALALLGGSFVGVDDVGEIADFAAVQTVVQEVPNVKAVVPMGIILDTLQISNNIDHLMNNLRRAIASKNADDIEAAHQTLRAVVADLQADAQRRMQILSNTGPIHQQLDDLAAIQTDVFWSHLLANPDSELLFLESRLGPLADDGQLLFLRNLGTDLQRFSQLFDRFEIIDGSMVPPGHRGFLFAKNLYEHGVKNRVARQLDDIHTSLVDKGKTIAGDPDLRDQVRRLPGQYQRVTYQLSAAQHAEVSKALRILMPTVQGDLTAQLRAFLAVDDVNFAERYQFFYTHIAPHIRLYDVNMGDTLTLRGMTRSGYVKAENVKVYGTFAFKGLEKSDLAGVTNLLDMQTFRDLYGYMTADKRAELASLKQALGVHDVGRDDAEAELFGAGRTAVAAEARPSNAAEVDRPNPEPMNGVVTDGIHDDVYDEATVNQGLALHAAVILADPGRMQQTRQMIQERCDAAGLGVKVVDWQTAAGAIGQFIVVVRIVLYVALFIIFAVALVIINNAMVMTTLERGTEIGTMRAIGAQRRFILTIFVMEAMILGVGAGLVGAALGTLAVQYLGSTGIPAISDIMVFLFSGPRLYPTASAANVGFAMVVIVIVTLLSTVYPARIATRIAPITAMQPKE